MTHLENRAPNTEKMVICNIRESFQSARMIYADQVVVTEEDHVDDDAFDFVYPCPPTTSLENWKIIEFPLVSDSCSK